MNISDNLSELMQTLPQELFDKIYDHIFTAEGEEQIVDWDYKPPAQLQVDRASREKFAKSYYGGETSFILPHGIGCGWLQTLPAAHFLTIKQIKCLCTHDRGPKWCSARDEHEIVKLSDLVRYFGYRVVDLRRPGVQDRQMVLECCGDDETTFGWRIHIGYGQARGVTFTRTTVFDPNDH